MSKGIREYPTDNLCVIGKCQMDVPDDLDLPFCAYHAKKAYVRIGEYFSVYRSTTLGAHPLGPTNERHGTVYVVKFADRVKIGFASNMKDRLTHVPHDEVIAAIPGTVRLERSLHQRFAEHRIVGEWFAADPDLVKFVVALEAASHAKNGNQQ